MITLNEIINNPKAMIHTPKEEQAKILCAELNKRGRKWCNGKSYANTEWHDCGSDTCYRPSLDVYCDLQWCKHDGYSIYEFDDVSDFRVKSDLTPRQWAAYRMIKEKSLQGSFCTQRDLCDGYSANDRKDGYVYVENPKHGDHCRAILNDVYAINESYEIEKIVVVKDMTYRLGTEEECADYYWRLVIPAGKKERRAKAIKDKMGRDGQGQLLSRRLKEIYDGSDPKTKRFIEAFIDKGPSE